MSNPPEPSWTPHPSGREHAEDLVEDGEVRGRLGLAFGLGAIVGVVVSALLSSDEDTTRTRVIKPRRFIRPSPPIEDDRAISLSEVAREEAADLIRGLFREVGGTLIHGALDYVTRPTEAAGPTDDHAKDPSPSPPGSTESSETDPT